MNLNGYKIRSAIKRMTRNRDVLQARFTKETHFFPSRGPRPDIEQTGADLNMAETILVRLQIIQMRYNLNVTVKPNGYEAMSLAAAIKQSGTRARLAAQWRKVSGGDKTSKYSIYGDTLSKDVEYQQETIATDQALALENTYSTSHASFQEVISHGNAQTVEFADAELEGLTHLFDR